MLLKTKKTHDHDQESNLNTLIKYMKVIAISGTIIIQGFLHTTKFL